MLTLQPYNGKTTRFRCPACGKPHQFTRYINTETNEYIHETVGKCNREIKCGYHYKPRDYYRDNPGEKKKYKPKPTKIMKENTHHACRQAAKPKATSYMTMDLVDKSLHCYDKNNLLRYLHSFLKPDTVMHLANIYYIGTSKHFGGGTTVFWQIDSQNKVRSGKLLHYNPETGHRDKRINWVHKVYGDYKDSGFNLKQCLFGEHLLQYDKSSPVALVESEKTAIIAMAHMPQYLWMATGSLNEFKASKLEILKNRIVLAFPDLGAYEKWQQKAVLLPFRVQISDYLERNASDGEREKGLDVGDFLGNYETEKL